MSGPVTLILGPFAFESLGFGFQTLSRELDTSWSDVKVAQTWDAIQWLGPSKQEADIKGVVFPEAFGGLSSLDGIRALAMAGTPMPLISLGGNVFGLFVVVAVKEEQSVFTAQGLPRQDQYTIRLRMYPGSGASALSAIVRLFG